MTRIPILLVLVWASVFVLPQLALAITIDTVFVGNAGNANDPNPGFRDPNTGALGYRGAVSYPYRIGTTEVTVGQYTAFLNAVAKTDTYALYNTSMATNRHSAGISRAGVSGSYAYSVIGSPNHPITFVNWGDAARFTNWLNNGQPTGAQIATTTEDGTYTLNGATTPIEFFAISRNTSAKWFLPTENEWYKAAYHQPAAAGGDSDNYWLYPMRTNSVPYSDQPPGATPDNTRVANFLQDDGIANGYNDGFAATGSPNYLNNQNYLTDVGAYSSSPSYYGTFDQGGNVVEWTETNVGISQQYRIVRGGNWVEFSPTVMASSESDFRLLTDEQDGLGFRMATLPEPSTLALYVTALVMFLPRASRRKPLARRS